MFDHDASKVDFRLPSAFFHDISAVASILKLFFRLLPEPIFTNDLYNEFIISAKIENHVARRDSLHALINQLADPNYATLRILMLHLHRVQEHSGQNRMDVRNLAICWGPTLFGEAQLQGGGLQDAQWAIKAVETILAECLAIFVSISSAISCLLFLYFGYFGLRRWIFLFFFGSRTFH